MDKNRLRALFLKRRMALDEKMHQLFNALLMENLTNVLSDFDAEKIAIFYPMRGEVDLRSLKKTYQTYLPKIKGNDLVFYLDEGVYEEAAFKTTVPAHDISIESQAIDLVIVPGLVYDNNRHRVGYGKGYYDRFLSRYEGIKIGVCFDLFRIDKIPTTERDVPVDILVTDQQIIRSE